MEWETLEVYMRRSYLSMDVLIHLNSPCLRWERFFSKPNNWHWTEE